VVVDDVEDLDVGAVGQPPVRRVGLPQLVGQGRLEPHERRARALVRLGRDQPVAAQDPPHRGRGGRRPESAADMVGDGRRTGVVAGGGELGAQCDDGPFDLDRGLV
jgi:hypothetical protein